MMLPQIKLQTICKLTLVMLFFVTGVSPLYARPKIDKTTKNSRKSHSEKRTPTQTTATQTSTNSYLKDPDNRISAEFKVSKDLHQRTAFWFDVYTKYGSDDNVIHHTLYPWIVYKIVDTRDLVNPPNNRFFKYNESKKRVNSDLYSVRAALKRLAKRTSFKDLKGLDKTLYSSLKSIPGKRRKVLQEAAMNVRVQLGQRDFFRSGLAMSSRYLPAMETVFEESGLPIELTRIPFVESSFNVKAESKVGASGIWQIMPRTGRSYLKVTNDVDERNSPLKASLAAVKIFKFNFKYLKDWPLAVTAYNHGPAGVKNALKKARARNLAQLIKRYHKDSFRFASANFYPSFLAVLHADRYHREIFESDPVEYEPYQEFQVLSLMKPISYKSLVDKIGMTSDSIVEFNLDLKNASKANSILPKGYQIILPTNKELPELLRSVSKYPTLLKEAALTINASSST